MKRVVIFLLIGSLMAACNGNHTAGGSTTLSDSTKSEALTDSSKYTSLQWTDSIHQELSKVKAGQVVEVAWHFKNTGDHPLIISNATASCGCTVAEKPEQPVAPGETGIVKAKFNSEGREGEQNKQVYVTANTKGTTYHQLSFRVQVEK